MNAAKNLLCARALALATFIFISNPLYAQQADLGLIKKHRPVRYLAIGGSLSAGVMHGV